MQSGKWARGIGARCDSVSLLGFIQVDGWNQELVLIMQVEYNNCTTKHSFFHKRKWIILSVNVHLQWSRPLAKWSRSQLQLGGYVRLKKRQKIGQRYGEEISGSTNHDVRLSLVAPRQSTCQHQVDSCHAWEVTTSRQAWAALTPRDPTDWSQGFYGSGVLSGWETRLTTMHPQSFRNLGKISGEKKIYLKPTLIVHL